MAGVGPSLTLVSESEERTRAIGEQLGRLLRCGDVVLLDGDLGAGKTTLTQGIARGLGVSDDVRSPTFTLVDEHKGRLVGGEPIRLYHLDLYRLTGEAELDSFGFEDYLAPIDGVSVIEWPERAGLILPEAYLVVRLAAVGPETRRLAIEAVPAAGPAASVVAEMRRAVGSGAPAR